MTQRDYSITYRTMFYFVLAQRAIQRQRYRTAQK